MENLPPTTTMEEDNKLALNRKLDFLVEITQTTLALAITIATIYISIKGIQSETMTNSFFLIVGFYFGKQFKDGVTKIGLSIRDINK